MYQERISYSRMTIHSVSSNPIPGTHAVKLRRAPWGMRTEGGNFARWTSALHEHHICSQGRTSHVVGLAKAHSEVLCGGQRVGCQHWGGPPAAGMHWIDLPYSPCCRSAVIVLLLLLLLLLLRAAIICAGL